MDKEIKSTLIFMTGLSFLSLFMFHCSDIIKWIGNKRYFKPKLPEDVLLFDIQMGVPHLKLTSLISYFMKL